MNYADRLADGWEPKKVKKGSASWFFKDSDKDGVMNGVDCKPYDKNKQDAFTNLQNIAAGYSNAVVNNPVVQNYARNFNTWMTGPKYPPTVRTVKEFNNMTNQQREFETNRKIGSIAGGAAMNAIEIRGAKQLTKKVGVKIGKPYKTIKRYPSPDPHLNKPLLQADRGRDSYLRVNKPKPQPTIIKKLKPIEVVMKNNPRWDGKSAWVGNRNNIVDFPGETSYKTGDNALVGPSDMNRLYIDKRYANKTMVATYLPTKQGMSDMQPTSIVKIGPDGKVGKRIPYNPYSRTRVYVNENESFIPNEIQGYKRPGEAQLDSNPYRSKITNWDKVENYGHGAQADGGKSGTGYYTARSMVIRNKKVRRSLQ